jgi:hypothetical protein
MVLLTAWQARQFSLPWTGWEIAAAGGAATVGVMLTAGVSATSVSVAVPVGAGVARDASTVVVMAKVAMDVGAGVSGAISLVVTTPVVVSGNVVVSVGTGALDAGVAVAGGRAANSGASS